MDHVTQNLERAVDDVTPALHLHGYFRSSAAWRVRIALNLKGLSAAQSFHHLRHGGQRTPDYLQLNPQGLVPTLEVRGAVLTQSLAICEWLDETYPDPPLLPEDALARARVRAFAYAIACDIHPLQNLKPLNRLRSLGLPEAEIAAWARWVMEDGLHACEALLAGKANGPFCFGQAVTLADICLVPQLSNARRFGCEIDRFPRLLAAEAACTALLAFHQADPSQQADAE